MQLIKSNIPTDRKNSFFIKVLSGILVFCLLLVSFVFLLIYQNVKKRSLEQSYLAEQDIVSNVSYSASIMQDTASSMLTQLNGDPKLLQLIYSMDTESLSVIQSMQLLQNYTRASSWLDSVYIYCAEEDCICYAYANGNTYQLSFGTLDDFFDARSFEPCSCVPCDAKAGNAPTSLPQHVLRQNRFQLCSAGQNLAQSL